MRLPNDPNHLTTGPQTRGNYWNIYTIITRELQFREKYQHGITVLEKMGFQVIEGSLTASQKSQGYRSGTPQERADEFMELIRNPNVSCLISTMEDQTLQV